MCIYYIYPTVQNQIQYKKKAVLSKYRTAKTKTGMLSVDTHRTVRNGETALLNHFTHMLSKHTNQLANKRSNECTDTGNTMVHVSLTLCNLDRSLF